jgi:hypothetical protein
MESKVAMGSDFLDVRNIRWGGFGKFLCAKYLSLVHTWMETAFFEQCAIVSTGPMFLESLWPADFTKMARQVWLLDYLFFMFNSGPRMMAHPSSRCAWGCGSQRCTWRASTKGVSTMPRPRTSWFTITIDAPRYTI